MSRNYEKNGILRLGLITIEPPPPRSLSSVPMSGGVIEFKNKGFDPSQTIKEMEKAAGDLTALGLMNGMIVEEVDVCGLASQYEEHTAKLVKMTLDFRVNKASIVVANDEVDMYNALNWLLNSITIEEL